MRIIHYSQKRKTTQMLISRQMDKLKVIISIQGNNSGIKRNEISDVRPWMKPENIISERIQSQKMMFCMISFI